MKWLYPAFLLMFISSSQAASNPNFYQQYLPQAQTICQNMSLDQKIGQIVMPSYVLLADAVSANGEACTAALNNHASPQQIITACGLNQIAEYHLGAVLTGGGPWFNAPTLQNWAQLNAWAMQQHQLGAPYDPLLLTGNDAVHGNMHLQGAVIFPHNIGLGATHDPQLIQTIGYEVGQDSLASGFNWVYAPTLAVAQDLRWGRTYESFAADPSLVKTMAQAFISGVQDIQGNQLNGPIATAKHFIGDGATAYGLDEGDDQYQGGEDAFWQENGLGYEGAVNANVGSMMVSYSAIDGDTTRMHLNGQWDILNQFKTNGIADSVNGNTYQFDGFVVTDWNGPTRAAYFYDQAHHTQLTLPEIYAMSINNGVDMIMLGQNDTTNPFDPNSAPTFTNVGEVVDAIKAAYQQGLISDARLDDAVTKILAVKLAMANPGNPISDQAYQKLQKAERHTALKAAEESMVLLKNEQGTLPVTANKIKSVVFIGPANDLGLQNGGWTVNWQGQRGDEYFTGADKKSSGANTLAQAVEKKLGNKVNYYFVTSPSQLPANLDAKSTIAIAVVAEMPYAEYMGDIGNSSVVDDWYQFGGTYGYNFYLGLPQSQYLGLMFNIDDTATVEKLHAEGIKLITVVYSGRPIIITGEGKNAPLENSDAVIAAFLPGTMGGKALAKAIFGDYQFRSQAQGQSNTLTFPWPRDMSDVENHFANGSLFPVGYGLAD